MHPGILQIPNNATHIAPYELNWVYDKNLQVFHKVSEVEQDTIQKVVTSANKQYTIFMKNRATVHFTINTRQIFAYLLAMYGKMSPIHLKNFEKEVTEMDYEPVTTVDNF